MIYLEEGIASVGPGWKPLVEAAYAALPEGVSIQIVKEKFGELRIYTSGPAVLVGVHDKFILQLTSLSRYICSVCGALGYHDTNNDHFWKTLCDVHWFIRNNPVED